MTGGPIQPVLTLHPPVYVVLSEHECRQCHKYTPVITLAAQRVEEDGPEVSWNEADEEGRFYVLSRIGTLPDPLLAILQRYIPSYRHRHSEETQTAYFMNHCLRCDAPVRDSDMHDVPGGAFFPEAEEDCDKLVFIELPPGKPFSLASSCALRGGFVLRNAARDTYRP